MIKKIASVLAVLIFGIFVFAGLQPAEYKISREILIKAPAENIFSHLNSGQKLDQWMPWQEEDPQVKSTYSGPAEGIGSKTAWESPGKMGVGEAVIVESVANQSVLSQITYMKPMQMSQMSEFRITPSAEGSLVSWSVKGRNNIFGRVMCLFVNMDKMVGTSFEKGLQKLKTLVEVPSPQI